MNENGQRKVVCKSFVSPQRISLSSFIRLTDKNDSIKKKKSYKELYCEKLNANPVKIPFSQNRYANYASLYQNSNKPCDDLEEMNYSSRVRKNHKMKKDGIQSCSPYVNKSFKRHYHIPGSNKFHFFTFVSKNNSEHKFLRKYDQNKGTAQLNVAFDLIDTINNDPNSSLQVKTTNNKKRKGLGKKNMHNTNYDHEDADLSISLDKRLNMRVRRLMFAMKYQRVRNASFLCDQHIKDDLLMKRFMEEQTELMSTMVMMRRVCRSSDSELQNSMVSNNELTEEDDLIDKYGKRKMNSMIETMPCKKLGIQGSSFIKQHEAGNKGLKSSFKSNMKKETPVKKRPPTNRHDDSKRKNSAKTKADNVRLNKNSKLTQAKDQSKSNQDTDSLNLMSRNNNEYAIKSDAFNSSDLVFSADNPLIVCDNDINTWSREDYSKHDDIQIKNLKSEINQDKDKKTSDLNLNQLIQNVEINQENKSKDSDNKDGERTLTRMDRKYASLKQTPIKNTLKQPKNESKAKSFSTKGQDSLNTKIDSQIENKQNEGHIDSARQGLKDKKRLNKDKKNSAKHDKEDIKRKLDNEVSKRSKEKNEGANDNNKQSKVHDADLNKKIDSGGHKDQIKKKTDKKEDNNLNLQVNIEALDKKSDNIFENSHSDSKGISNKKGELNEEEIISRSSQIDNNNHENSKEIKKDNDLINSQIDRNDNDEEIYNRIKNKIKKGKFHDEIIKEHSVRMILKNQSLRLISPEKNTIQESEISNKSDIVNNIFNQQIGVNNDENDFNKKVELNKENNSSSIPDLLSAEIIEDRSKACNEQSQDFNEMQEGSSLNKKKHPFKVEIDSIFTNSIQKGENEEEESSDFKKDDIPQTMNNPRNPIINNTPKFGSFELDNRNNNNLNKQSDNPLINAPYDKKDILNTKQNEDTSIKESSNSFKSVNKDKQNSTLKNNEEHDKTKIEGTNNPNQTIKSEQISPEQNKDITINREGKNDTYAENQIYQDNRENASEVNDPVAKSKSAIEIGIKEGDNNIQKDTISGINNDTFNNNITKFNNPNAGNAFHTSAKNQLISPNEKYQDVTKHDLMNKNKAISSFENNNDYTNERDDIGKDKIISSNINITGNSKEYDDRTDNQLIPSIENQRIVTKVQDKLPPENQYEGDNNLNDVISKNKLISSKENNDNIINSKVQDLMTISDLISSNEINDPNCNENNTANKTKSISSPRNNNTISDTHDNLTNTNFITLSENNKPISQANDPVNKTLARTLKDNEIDNFKPNLERNKKNESFSEGLDDRSNDNSNIKKNNYSNDNAIDNNTNKLISLKDNTSSKDNDNNPSTKIDSPSLNKNEGRIMRIEEGRKMIQEYHSEQKDKDLIPEVKDDEQKKYGLKAEKKTKNRKPKKTSSKEGEAINDNDDNYHSDEDADNISEDKYNINDDFVNERTKDIDNINDKIGNRKSEDIKSQKIHKKSKTNQDEIPLDLDEQLNQQNSNRNYTKDNEHFSPRKEQLNKQKDNEMEEKEDQTIVINSKESKTKEIPEEKQHIIKKGNDEGHDTEINKNSSKFDQENQRDINKGINQKKINDKLDELNTDDQKIGKIATQGKGYQNIIGKGGIIEKAERNESNDQIKNQNEFDANPCNIDISNSDGSKKRSDDYQQIDKENDNIFKKENTMLHQKIKEEGNEKEIIRETDIDNDSSPDLVKQKIDGERFIKEKGYNKVKKGNDQRPEKQGDSLIGQKRSFDQIENMKNSSKSLNKTKDDDKQPLENKPLTGQFYENKNNSNDEKEINNKSEEHKIESKEDKKSYTKKLNNSEKNNEITSHFDDNMEQSDKQKSSIKSLNEQKGFIGKPEKQNECGNSSDEKKEYFETLNDPKGPDKTLSQQRGSFSKIQKEHKDTIVKNDEQALSDNSLEDKKENPDNLNKQKGLISKQEKENEKIMNQLKENINKQDKQKDVGNYPEEKNDFINKVEEERKINQQKEENIAQPEKYNVSGKNIIEQKRSFKNLTQQNTSNEGKLIQQNDFKNSFDEHTDYLEKQTEQKINDTMNNIGKSDLNKGSNVQSGIQKEKENKSKDKKEDINTKIDQQKGREGNPDEQKRYVDKSAEQQKNEGKSSHNKDNKEIINQQYSYQYQLEELNNNNKNDNQRLDEQGNTIKIIKEQTDLNNSPHEKNDDDEKQLDIHNPTSKYYDNLGDYNKKSDKQTDSIEKIDQLKVYSKNSDKQRDNIMKVDEQSKDVESLDKNKVKTEKTGKKYQSNEIAQGNVDLNKKTENEGDNKKGINELNADKAVADSKSPNINKGISKELHSCSNSERSQNKDEEHFNHTKNKNKNEYYGENSNNNDQENYDVNKKDKSEQKPKDVEMSKDSTKENGQENKQKQIVNEEHRNELYQNKPKESDILKGKIPKKEIQNDKTETGELESEESFGYEKKQANDSNLETRYNKEKGKHSKNDLNFNNGNQTAKDDKIKEILSEKEYDKDGNELNRGIVKDQIKETEKVQETNNKTNNESANRIEENDNRSKELKKLNSKEINRKKENDTIQGLKINEIKNDQNSRTQHEIENNKGKDDHINQDIVERQEKNDDMIALGNINKKAKERDRAKDQNNKYNDNNEDKITQEFDNKKDLNKNEEIEYKKVDNENNRYSENSKELKGRSNTLLSNQQDNKGVMNKKNETDLITNDEPFNIIQRENELRNQKNQLTKDKELDKYYSQMYQKDKNMSGEDINIESNRKKKNEPASLDNKGKPLDDEIEIQNSNLTELSSKHNNYTSQQCNNKDRKDIEGNNQEFNSSNSQNAHFLNKETISINDPKNQNNNAYNIKTQGNQQGELESELHCKNIDNKELDPYHQLNYSSQLNKTELRSKDNNNEIKNKQQHTSQHPDMGFVDQNDVEKTSKQFNQGNTMYNVPANQQQELNKKNNLSGQMINNDEKYDDSAFPEKTLVSNTRGYLPNESNQGNIRQNKMQLHKKNIVNPFSTSQNSQQTSNNSMKYNKLAQKGELYGNLPKDNQNDNDIKEDDYDKQQYGLKRTNKQSSDPFINRNENVRLNPNDNFGKNTTEATEDLNTLNKKANYVDYSPREVENLCNSPADNSSKNEILKYKNNKGKSTKLAQVDKNTDSLLKQNKQNLKGDYYDYPNEEEEFEEEEDENMEQRDEFEDHNPYYKDDNEIEEVEDDFSESYKNSLRNTNSRLSSITKNKNKYESINNSKQEGTESNSNVPEQKSSSLLQLISNKKNLSAFSKNENQENNSLNDNQNEPSIKTKLFKHNNSPNYKGNNPEKTNTLGYKGSYNPNDEQRKEQNEIDISSPKAKLKNKKVNTLNDYTEQPFVISTIRISFTEDPNQSSKKRFKISVTPSKEDHFNVMGIYPRQAKPFNLEQHLFKIENQSIQMNPSASKDTMKGLQCLTDSNSNIYSGSNQGGNINKDNEELYKIYTVNKGIQFKNIIKENPQDAQNNQIDFVDNEINSFIEHMKLQNKTKEENLANIISQKDKEIKLLKEQRESLYKQKQLNYANRSNYNIFIYLDDNRRIPSLTNRASTEENISFPVNTNRRKLNENEINAITYRNINDRNMSKPVLSLNTKREIDNKKINPLSVDDPSNYSNSLLYTNPSASLGQNNKINLLQNFMLFNNPPSLKTKMIHLNQLTPKNKNEKLSLKEQKPIQAENTTYLNLVKEDIKQTEKHKKKSSGNKTKLPLPEINKKKVKSYLNIIMPPNNLEDVFESKDYYFLEQ